METATEKDTRLFRFGAVVPEEHQDLALRLAALEDRLNEKFAMEEPARSIYFIPTIVDTFTGVPPTVEQAEDHLSIRLETLPDYEALVQRFLAALVESGAFEESWIAEVEACLQNEPT
jgi:hypothetical protein